MICTVLQIDAFTSTPGQGNPAGVVLNGDDFTSDQMQAIAKQIGFNETAFICTSELADIKLRYFTPGHETPLCGHATIASIVAMYCDKEDQKMSIETKAGILPIVYFAKKKEVIMKQAKPKFKTFDGDILQLCESLNIREDELEKKLPIQYGNTGSWTLLLPVKNAAILDKMKPLNERFPSIFTQLPNSSIHPFAIANENSNIFYARHFSSPYSGTVEDSVTGTASGVLGAYALNNIFLKETMKEIQVFQGKQVGRCGDVTVTAIRKSDFKHDVYISGTGCFNKQINIEK